MWGARYRNPIVILIALSTACATAPTGSEPELVAVHPDRGGADAPVNVRIRGAGFSPALYRNLSCDGESLDVDDIFAATLTGVGQQEIALNAVTWVSASEIAATIPAGLAPGVYDLTVVDPRGRTLDLLEAYQVNSSDGDTDSGTETDTDTYECTDTDDCVMNCDEYCELYCGGTSNCHLNCNWNECDLTCDEDATCTMNCNDGACTATSTSTGLLAVICNNGTCQVSCQGPGGCTIQCDGGGCAITDCPDALGDCGDDEACDAECP